MTSESTSARALVLYQGQTVTVTTSYIESAGYRFPLSELDDIQRVEHAGRAQSRLYELWARFRGEQVRLFASHDVTEFGQVARALTRAREVAGRA